MAVDMKQLHLQVFGDSQLVINQLLGSYEVKNPELRPYHDYAQKLIRWLGDVTLQHVCRTENKKADALATLASTLTLPDQTQVTVCQKWIVPPSNEEEYIENDLEHIIAIVEAAKIGDNPSLTTYVMGYFQKIQEEELIYIIVHLVSFTIRIHYIEDHLRVCYYDVWESKKRFKLCKKHTQEYQYGPKLHFHIKRMGYY